MNVFQFPQQESIDRLRNIVNEPRGIEWPNVIVTTSEKKYKKSVYESSFTILANKKGIANLYVNKRNLKICEQTFFICNPFENFNYEIYSDDEVETFNVHLNYDFYMKAQYAFLSSNEKLLDYPFENDITYKYTNQLHFRTPGFNRIIKSYKENKEELFLTEILRSCLILDHKEKGRNINIPAAKKSTKQELIKRMVVAKDYIYSNYNNPTLSVGYVSECVSMSHFHFLRIFRHVYGISPYQYLKGIRIEKAKYLIRKTQMPIDEIAYAVGFREATTLYPILKKELAQTPLEYRKKISNFQ